MPLLCSLPCKASLKNQSESPPQGPGAEVTWPPWPLRLPPSLPFPHLVHPIPLALPQTCHTHSHLGIFATECLPRHSASTCPPSVLPLFPGGLAPTLPFRRGLPWPIHSETYSLSPSCLLALHSVLLSIVCTPIWINIHFLLCLLFVCSLMYTMCLQQCVAHSRCSVNIIWMNNIKTVVTAL